MDWPELLAWIYAGFIGACLGSFYYAVATRVSWFFYSPHRKEITGRANRFKALLFRPSFCMSCRTPIKRLYLIPIAGYFISGGRCKACGEKFSPAHAASELGFAALMFWLLYSGSSWPQALVQVLFCGHLLIAFVTDSRHFLLDHENTGVLIALAAVHVALEPEPVLPALLSAGAVTLFFAGAYVTYRLLKRSGLGAGDILFSGAAALYAGFPGCLPVFGCAGALAAAYSLKEKGPAPFGACLAAALGLWTILFPVLS